MTSAIAKIRRGHVAGDAGSLVDLLISPENLTPVQAAGGEGIDPSLSAEQAQAVARVLASRQGFFIQGPPGTGKTTVITEIIRQLTARGERVLLAAPMHVAVDEVLQRLQDDPGIWPMRVARDTKNIRDGLERFSEEQLQAGLAEGIRARLTRVRDDWPAEAADLRRRLAALEVARHALAAHRTAERALTRLRTQDAPGAARLRLADLDDRLVVLSGTTAAAAKRAADAAALVAETSLLAPEIAAAESRAAGAAALLAECVTRFGEDDRAARLAEGVAAAAGQRAAEASGQIARLTMQAAQTEAAIDQWQQQLSYDTPIFNRLTWELAQHQAVLSQASQVASSALGAYRAAFQQAGIGTQLAVGMRRGRLAGMQSSLHALQLREKQAEAAVTAKAREKEAMGRRVSSAQAALVATRTGTAELNTALASWKPHHRELDAEARTRAAAADAARRQLASTAAAREDLRRTLEQARQAAQVLTARRAAANSAQEKTDHEYQSLISAGTALWREKRELHEQHAAAVSLLDAAAREVTATAGPLRAANATLLEACHGEPPADPDEDEARTRSRVERLNTLIRLEARWRELLGTEAGDGGSADQLGRTLVDAANLVCSTVIGIHGSPSAKGADFDTLILDEASRVIDTDFLVPAVRARRWVLVGDERQLPPYVDQEAQQHVHALLALHDRGPGEIDTQAAVARVAKAHALLAPSRPIRQKPTADLAAAMDADSTWETHYRDHLGKVLADLSTGLAEHDGAGPGPVDVRTLLLTALAVSRSVSRFEACVTLPSASAVTARLTVQRRMITPIADLVSGPVYGGNYHSPDPAERRIVPFTGDRYPEPVSFYDTRRSPHPERSAGTGFVNDLEARMVVKLLHIWDGIAGQAGQPERPTFSVLSFYKAQAALIERRLDQHPPRKLTRNVIDSIDKIQGQESDLVVISFVRALRNGQGRAQRPKPGTMLWLQDIHRLNVAVTRARLALAFVGDRPTLEQLSGGKQAEEFYRNLFDALDAAEPGMQYVTDFAP